MRKFLKSTVAFLAFLVVFYPVLLFVWGIGFPSFLKSNLNYPLGISGHQYTRLKEVKTIDSVDVLFLGPSLAYRGFDPRIFQESGMSSFNLGSSNQTPVQTKLLLKRYLQKVHPKLIVYEVEPETFASDGVESALDMIANDRNDRHSLKMALDLNHIKVYNALLYAWIREALGLNSSFKEPIVKGEDRYISGGFVEKEIRCFKKVSHQPRTWTFNEKQWLAFNEVVNLIQEKKIELILVSAPVTTSLYKSYQNSREFDQLMGNYSKYYNFNEILPLNDSLYFYDPFHLNQHGVKLLNGKLIEIIKENKVLSYH